MRKTQIIGVSILGAAVYGTVHDQITVRLCLEYFTLAHPAFFPTSSPTALAFCWGVAGTIWLGAIFGGVLAFVSESEGLPPVPVSRLAQAIVGLLLITALAAAAAGFAGFELARRSIVSLPADLGGLLLREQQHRFVAVWFAHVASYAVGMGGGALVIIALWRQRGRPRVFPLVARSAPAIIRTCILIAIVILIVVLRYASR
jgi:hypothetical protein